MIMVFKPNLTCCRITCTATNKHNDMSVLPPCSCYLLQQNNCLFLQHIYETILKNNTHLCRSSGHCPASFPTDTSIWKTAPCSNSCKCTHLCLLHTRWCLRREVQKGYEANVSNPMMTLNISGLQSSRSSLSKAVTRMPEILNEFKMIVMWKAEDFENVLMAASWNSTTAVSLHSAWDLQNMANIVYKPINGR